MSTTRYSSFAMLLGMALAADAAYAGSLGTVRLSASDNCVNADEISDPITVTLDFENLVDRDLISFEAELAFDTGSLTYVSGVLGDQWASGTISASGGTIEIVASTPPSDPATGDPILFATLTFSAATATDCDGTSVTYVSADAIDTDGMSGNLSLGGMPPIVIDTTAPTIACPDDVTVDCGDPTHPGATGMATASDDCALMSISSSDVTTPGDDCENDGIVEVITRTWTATDFCGNSSTCVQTIEVVDLTAPTITPAMDMTVECGPGNATAFDDWLTANGGATADDACSAVTWTTSPATPTLSDGCGATGTATVTFIASDECGNTATTSATFTVEDTTAPTLTIPDDATVECGAPTGPDDLGDATASDACGGVTITFDDVVTPVLGCAGGVFETIERTWTATDACGNSSSETQTITVEDTTPPMITSCPANVTGLQCDDDVPDPDPDAVVATDACSSVTVVHDGDTFTGTGCGASPKIITRTYRATDECGNSSTCTQTLTVADTTPPTLSLTPADVTIEGCTVPDAPEVTASDNCDGDLGVIAPVEDLSGLTECGGTGTVTRTWTATDGCGNTTEHVQTITLVDTTRPTITTFPADESRQCVADVPPPDTGLVAATDNCTDSMDIVIEHVLDSPSGGGCPGDALVITRIYRARDLCGNVATRFQLFTVVDTTPPTIDSCPGDMTLACDDDTSVDALGSATATDNCDGVVEPTHEDVESGDPCDPLDPLTITRTWTATDACGNTATCTQTITLVDVDPPTFDLEPEPGLEGCPPDMTVSADANAMTATVDPGVATAEDDCDGAPTVVGLRIDGDDLSDPYPIGMTTITWTATDCNGNSTTCTQTITVLDQNEIVATVELRHVVPGEIVRCIEFELLLDCEPTSVATYPTNVTFTDGVGTATLIAPVGDYTCLTARDPLHTMRRTADTGDGNFAVVAGTYEADFTLDAGNDLIPGNLDGDNDVDVIDGTRYILEFMSDNAPGADTPCSTPAFHADIDGDGIVGGFDFALLFGQIGADGEADCCGDAATTIDLAVPVGDLERRGMGELAVVDLNGDGWLDLQDLAAFLAGARPIMPPIAEPERTWFDQATWDGGPVPRAGRDHLVDRPVLVDRVGAEARDLEIAAGGRLRIAGGTLASRAIVVRSGGALIVEGVDALLTTGSLVLEDGATLGWRGGVIEIVGGVLEIERGDLVVGTVAEASVLRLLDQALAIVPRDVHVGVGGGFGVIELVEATLVAGRDVRVGETGTGVIELDGHAELIAQRVIVGAAGWIGGTGVVEGELHGETAAVELRSPGTAGDRR